MAPRRARSWSPTSAGSRQAGSYPSSFVNFNGTLFFAEATALTEQVWESNGTATGTLMVTDINPGGGVESNSLSRTLAAHSSSLSMTELTAPSFGRAMGPPPAQ